MIMTKWQMLVSVSNSFYLFRNFRSYRLVSFLSVLLCTEEISYHDFQELHEL